MLSMAWSLGSTEPLKSHLAHDDMKERLKHSQQTEFSGGPPKTPSPWEIHLAQSLPLKCGQDLGE